MERSTIVRVHDGLHARPATRFVKLAKGFESDIELIKMDKSVSAKSSVKLMLLGVKENEEVTVRATGADEIEAIEALIGYLEDPHAGTADEASAEARAAESAAPVKSTVASADTIIPGTRKIRGVAASEGFAIGPAFGFFPAEIKQENRLLSQDEISAEAGRLTQAFATVQRRMDASLAATDLAESDRGIIAALKDIACDDELTRAAEALVKDGMDAVSAVIGATSRIAADFASMDDPYLNARADDVNAVGRQICLALLGQDDANLDAIPSGAILIADDIGAWDLARAPLNRIAGVICGHGGATSHVAIIARAHGIPAALGLGPSIHDLQEVKTIALDGNSGDVFPDPDQSTADRFHAQIGAEETERQALKAYKNIIPKRADGTIIEIAANLGSLEEIETAQEAGAMGVGLFRTELLFMRHIHLPSEDLQTETYMKLATAFAPDPVIVRTLDIGGDKPISGIDFPDEENPFLGWRGIRMCLDRPDVFKPQLRALLRAAVHGNIKVMLPMVSDIGEVRATRRLIDECAAELVVEGKDHRQFDLGVMVETPAAVMIAPMLAKEVAFFSIGTNDLTQYIMAADRLNPTVAKLNDVTHPAVMAAIELTTKAGVDAGIMVGMCGEAAGRVDLIPAFVKMGLTELSMSPSSIQRAKKCVSELALG
ncbi:phosphoenolpyruvate--protein phosphotransferase [Phyllobacterium endophyticum]|uniref:Phosphoenolpyruvate-protein phosphotransferase n=1 Tax=Phyllobacterium endophyticum TaxID=1149773 RepID=A0A2P7ANR7_9HYPH|nr:phosphoenolpyruvate--protein phosphotransferase [Phyllobacterium endophyticum]MBB3233827.1 phosphocarrier protein FPr [Phyllobacterium endophyticum]PSH55844.1 phosphoenolpyruvate--protein phosphotransferase [Phyllobacterium endophyticum]TYR43631.1 phosphoenolpyruvate--protein phosphotransferase [Phyllobacterium endophyticum]